MIHKVNKIIFFLFSLLILLGCVKDISLDSNLSTISTYDAYLPEGHNMNQNGLFFIDKNKDTANNNYVSLFGFDNNARIKFNNRLLVKNLIQNSENYNNIRFNKLHVDNDKVLVTGDAIMGNSIFIYISEINQASGSINSFKVIELSNTLPINEYFTDLVKTSNGYELFVFGQFGFENIIKRTKTDKDFNVNDNSNFVLGPANGNFEYIYCDATVSPNDDLIIGYWGIQGSKPNFIVKSLSSNYNLNFLQLENWSSSFTADFNNTNPELNLNQKLIWFNNNILLFKTGYFSVEVAGVIESSTSPCLYSLNPNSGLVDSQLIIDQIYPLIAQQGVSYNTENLLNVSVFNDKDIIISGYITHTNGVVTASMNHYDNDFNCINSFFITPNNTSGTISRFHYVGLNNISEYIGTGYCPRFSSGIFVDPTIYVEPLSVFVGLYNIDGELKFE